jgi:hypothetical protein
VLIGKPVDSTPFGPLQSFEVSVRKPRGRNIQTQSGKVNAMTMDADIKDKSKKAHQMGKDNLLVAGNED